MINISLTYQQHLARKNQTSCNIEDLYYIKTYTQGQPKNLLQIQFLLYPDLLQKLQESEFNLQNHQINKVGSNTFSQFYDIEKDYWSYDYYFLENDTEQIETRYCQYWKVVPITIENGNKYRVQYIDGGDNSYRQCVLDNMFVQYYNGHETVRQKVVRDGEQNITISGIESKNPYCKIFLYDKTKVQISGICSESNFNQSDLIGCQNLERYIITSNNIRCISNTYINHDSSSSDPNIYYNDSDNYFNNISSTRQQTFFFNVNGIVFFDSEQDFCLSYDELQNVQVSGNCSICAIRGKDVKSINLSAIIKNLTTFYLQNCVNLFVNSGRYENINIQNSNISEAIIQNSNISEAIIQDSTISQRFESTNNQYGSLYIKNNSFYQSRITNDKIIDQLFNIDNTDFKSLSITDLQCAIFLLSNCSYIGDFYINNLFFTQKIHFLNNKIGQFLIDDLFTDQNAYVHLVTNSIPNFIQGLGMENSYTVEHPKTIRIQHSTIYDCKINFKEKQNIILKKFFYNIDLIQNCICYLDLVSKNFIRYCSIIFNSIFQAKVSDIFRLNISKNNLCKIDIYKINFLSFLNNKKMNKLQNQYDILFTQPFYCTNPILQYDTYGKQSVVIIDQLYTNQLQYDGNTIERIHIKNTPIQRLDFYYFTEDVISLQLQRNYYLSELYLHQCHVKQLYVIDCAISNLDVNQNYLNIQKLVVYGNKKRHQIISKSSEPQIIILGNSLNYVNINKQLVWLQLHDCFNKQLNLMSDKYVYLDISNNCLQRLSLSEKPQNLQYFDISSNNGIDFIKIGDKENDLRNLINLQYANISDNNFKYFYLNNCSLKKFVCYNNSDMTRIYLNNNQIENCQFYNCPELRTVDVSNQNKQIQQQNSQNQTITVTIQTLNKFVCYNSQLSQLNIDGNPNLNYIDVHNNKLNILKIDQNLNRSLPLQYLDIRNNNVNYLNISNFDKLKTLLCSNNKNLRIHFSTRNLQYLQAQSIKLKVLDLANAYYLWYINVNNNYLEKIDLSNTICRELYAQNNNLKFVQFGNCSNVNACLQGNNIEVMNSKNNNNIKFDHVQQLYLTNDNLNRDIINNINHLYVEYTNEEHQNQNIIISNKNIYKLQLSNKTGNIWINNSIINQIKISRCSSEIINLSNNQIQQLILSKTDSVKRLYLSDNPIINIQLCKMNQIQYIDMQDCFIKQNDFNKIIDQFIYNINFDTCKNGTLVIKTKKFSPYCVLTEHQKNIFLSNQWNII